MAIEIINQKGRREVKMIATRQRSNHSLFRFSDISALLFAVQNRCRKALLFLLSTEDSSGDQTAHITPYLGSFRGSIKALFWTGAAINLGVLIGQLH